MNGIIAEPEKTYYVNLREFANGAFEVVLKVVKPLKAEMMDAAINGVLTSGFTSLGKPKTDEEKAATRQANHERAVRRAKQNIRWLCKMMEADRLLTLTYRENMEDRDKLRGDFQEFLRLVRKRHPNWRYVAVVEKQDRGAYHIHCAVKGFQYIKFLRECWHKALGCSGTMHGEDSPGNVDVTSPKKRFGKAGREWKTDKLASYLTKYLAKTFDGSETEKRRYWHAKGLAVPQVQRFWVGGQNIIDAVKSTVWEALPGHSIMVYPDWDMWISPQEDCFWMAGRRA